MPQARFSVDPQRVVHETIGDETILINLEAGTYHSLTGSGPAIWTLLVAGCTAEEAARELRGRHPETSEAEIEAAVGGLVAQLLEADLLDADAERSAPEPVAPPADGPFAPATFQSYSDMQYLLLLDPIHDVAPEGWPAPSEPVEGRSRHEG